MEPTSTASIKAARWYLAMLVAINLYRAITQSVTPDEAWNYDRFIGPSWSEAFSHFDVNNHVLNTLLVRISTTRFHLTELSLRLPSLLAGLLYLWMAFRLARRWFGDGLNFLAALGLLTLNPAIVDSLSEARGYGMALAAWMWALELVLESIQAVSPRKPKLAAVCLGLSVVASFAFLAPAFALMVVYLAWMSGVPETRGSRWALPQIFLLTLFVLLVIPMNRMEWKTLAVGATSLRQTINEITALSLGTSAPVAGAVARVLLAVLAIAGLAAAIRYRRQRESAVLVLTGATLPLTLVLLLLAHRWWGTPFPQQGALYLIPLCVLLFTAIILNKYNSTVRLGYQCLVVLLLICYVSIFPFGTYASGAPFADARTLAKILRQKAAGREVRIGASLAVEPILNYYRARYRQGNWHAIERAPLTGTYDYYVLTPADAALIDQRHLHVQYRDSGLTLAE